MMVKIEQFVIEGLGHQSYLVTDDESGTAAVVDPRRDIEIYLYAANRNSIKITHVLETHIHNDYVSGAQELAAQTGATIVASALDPLHYSYQPVQEGDSFAVGHLTFETLATPGHTPEHISYLLHEPESKQASALFSGGSLLAANAGRTDLLGEALTLKLTRQQYGTLKRLLTTLPEQVRVYPTHGAGSFCMSTDTYASARTTTIAQERLINPAVLAKDEEAFVKQQLANYTPYPSYYRHVGSINRTGPRVLGKLPEPPPLDPYTTWLRMGDGMPLVDGRKRDAFAREHIPGALNIQLEPAFATYVGWLLPFNVPLMLLVEDEAGRREAVVQLMRIGFEQIEGYLDGGMAMWKAAALPSSDFETIEVETLYKRLMRNERFMILDVRRPDEWHNGHIPGAQNIHVSDLPQRLDGLPMDKPLITICHTGYRAEIAASILAASGREVIAVRDGMEDWFKKRFPFVIGGNGPEEPVHNQDDASHAHP